MICSVSWETVAGISSAIIAFCALGLTLWQACVMRRHNKLSVQPYLTTWVHRDEGPSHFILVVDLLNNGVGPALIKTFKVFVDGHEIKGQEDEPMQKALKLLFPQYIYQSNQSFMSDGYMMSPKESRNLVTIKFTGSNLPKTEEIEHAKNRVNISIRYESIYRESQTFDTSKDGLN
jgi:hypothetical protein